MVRAALVRVSARWGGIDVAVVAVIASILAAAATTAEVRQVTIVIIRKGVNCRTCAGGKGPAAPSWRIRHRTRA